MIRTSLITVLTVLLSLSILAQDQSANKYIKINGKLLSAGDSSAISASLFYEKLPYYDDMGMSSSAQDGSFEIYLLDQTKYNFKVEKVSGFQPFADEILVTGQNGEQDLTLYISPREKEELITLDITFSSGSPDLTANSFKVLDDFIDYINARPDVDIQLEGHTDIGGDAAANMALSQARVETVEEYITKNGVKKNRVTTKAFGETQPLSTERTPEAIAANRRVEVRLIRKD